MTQFTRCWRAVVTLLLAAVMPCHAQQDFPSRPVSLVVPFAAGGSSDIIARILSDRLGAGWGQPVVVENRPGAMSVVGTEFVAKAAPDGHTLLVTNVALVIHEALSRKLPYHALRDFAPVALVARQYTALVASPVFQVQNVAQLIDAAKARSGAIHFRSGGEGTVSHLAGSLFRIMAGINVQHVPGKGSARTLLEITTQPDAFAILGLPQVMPHVTAGRLRVLALTGVHRSSVLPDIPTVGETLPGYEVNNWVGLLAPYGISVPVVRKLYADLEELMRRPDFRDVLVRSGFDLENRSPGAFHTLLVSDIDRFVRIVGITGLRTD